MEKRKATPEKWRKTIRLRWLSRCAYCGEFVGSDEHIDHIVSLKAGGSNNFFNLTFSCAECNLKKGTKKQKPRKSSVIGNVLAAIYYYDILKEITK